VKYKLVIFDFDGTLADSFPWVLQILDQVSDKFRVKRIAKNDIDTLRSSSARKLLKSYGVPVWKLPLMARYVRSLMAEDIYQVPLFAGIDSLIRRLAEQGLSLALVSSNSSKNVHRVLGPEIVPLISYYECSVSLFGKPARLKKILQKSGVSPHEAICIGDEIRDIEAAGKMSIPFGAVAWGYTRLEALMAHSPQEVFNTVDEIAELVG
jgi:phosphoglycolate phosphatase